MTEQETQNKGPNLQALGFKSPMEIIDLLALIKVDGEPIIRDDKAWLDPKLKTQTIMEYFLKKFNVKPQDLPYVAASIKHDLKSGKLQWSK
ncbi:MAG: hypothetical protein ABH823_04010 [bacterium]